MTRRLGVVAGFITLLAVLAFAPTAGAAPESGTAGVPGAEPGRAEAVNTTTPIKHFIFLMQENHSFDNYFGTYPGADGIPEGVCMPHSTEDASEGCLKPSHVENREIEDLRHNPETHAAQFNNGKMNGFVSAFVNDEEAGLSAMSYYDDRDLPWYWNIADNYVLFDRFFSSAKGGSVRNHLYWVAGAPGVAGNRDALPDGGWGDGIPTVFDRLEAAGISWKFYIQNYDPSVNIRAERVGDKGAQVVWAPMLAMPRFLDNPTLANKIVDLSEYHSDLAHNTLPAVAFIVPSGTSEHPPGSIQAGQAFVRTLVTGLMRSESWNSSAFMWSYDDWGGFYDHVTPPQVDEAGYGFRVPALLISPYAKRGHVDSTVLDFTSGLAFIRENWGIEPLAARDGAAKSFASAFDFTLPPRPPEMLPASREPTTLPPANTSLLYPGYGFALALPLAIAVGTAAHGRRRVRALGRNELSKEPVQ